MAQNSLPNSEDLSAYLTAAGLTPGNINLGIPLSATVLEWQRRTGFAPFLAGPEETRTFPLLCGNVLELSTGLVSLASLSIDEQLYLPAFDFRLVEWRRGMGAADGLSPYTRIEFPRGFSGQRSATPDRLSLTGRFGFALTVPDDAWQAIVEGAARRVATSLASVSTLLGATQTKIGDVELKFHEARPAGNFIAPAAIAAYRRTFVA